MLSKLKTEEKLVGVKQSKKAIKEGRAAVVFIAEDSETRVKEPVGALCRELGVEIFSVSTMRELGEACGIEIGAAVAVILK